MTEVLTRPPAAPGVDPAPEPADPTTSRPEARAHVAVLATALAAWLAALARVDIDAMGDTGLISVLPWMFWLAGAQLTVGFALLLTSSRPKPALVVAYVVGLVVLLHATPTLLQAEARFPTAWLHAGYVDHIVDTGEVLPRFDARFNWPGGFSFGALLVTATGVEPHQLLRWTPLVVNLAFLLPVRALASATCEDRRARAAAPWFFVLATWVGQDYFAPQALGFLLHLTCVAVLLRWFRTAGRQGPGTAPPSTSPGTRVALVCLLLVFVGAMTVSHQLSPFMLVAASVALVVVDRVPLRGFPVLVGVVALAWLSFGAEAYWRGHLDFLTGGVGDVGGIVDQNIGQRIVGNDARQLVLRVRLGFTALVGALAAVGFLRSCRAGRPAWTVLALAASPLPAIALQGYGGELFLRVWFFCTPFVAVLAAQACFGNRDRDGRATRLPALAFAAVTLLALPLFMVARYGNERFEQVYPADLRAVEAVHANAEPGSTVLALNFAGPWRFEHLERFDTAWLEGGVPDVAEIEARLAQGDPASYLLLTRGQAAHGEIVTGMERGWIDELERRLLASDSFCTVHRDDGASVLRWRDASAQPAGGCGDVRRWSAADRGDRR